MRSMRALPFFGLPAILTGVLAVLLIAAACSDNHASPTSASTTGSTAGSSCSVTVQLSQSTVDLKGGQIHLIVTTEPACQWTVTLPAWIRVVSQYSGTGTYAGTGTGSVNLWIEVAASTSPRDGLISVNSASVRVYQETDCSVGLRPPTLSFDQSGGHASVPLIASLPTCDWSLDASGWIGVQPASGTGNATIAVDVSPSQSARTGFIATAGSWLGVNQAPTGADAQFSFGWLSCATIRPGDIKPTVCLFFVRPGTNPTSSNIGVSADLRSIGGRENVGALAEMGTDGLGFSLDLSIPSDLAPGIKAIPLVAHDAQGRTATAVATIPVLSPQ